MCSALLLRSSWCEIEATGVAFAAVTQPAHVIAACLKFRLPARTGCGPVVVWWWV
jgi:hypothetical protein